MKVLIKDTAKSREALKLKLEEGKDQLIEINSHSTEVSTELIGKIRESEKSAELESLMLRLFDLFGLGVDDAGRQTYRLTNTERLPVNLLGHRVEPWLSLLTGNSLSAGMIRFTYPGITQSSPEPSNKCSARTKWHNLVCDLGIRW